MPAQLMDLGVPFQVYCDGSGFKGGIGVLVVLYIWDREVKVLHYFLGTDKQHIVYGAKGVGMILVMHLLKDLSSQMNNMVAIETDSQALTKALENQHSHAGQYILDEIHNTAKQ
jgi:hypothetical protein